MLPQDLVLFLATHFEMEIAKQAAALVDQFPGNTIFVAGISFGDLKIDKRPVIAPRFSLNFLPLTATGELARIPSSGAPHFTTAADLDVITARKINL